MICGQKNIMIYSDYRFRETVPLNIVWFVDNTCRLGREKKNGKVIKIYRVARCGDACF